MENLKKLEAVPTKKTGRKPKERRIENGVRFCETHSYDSLSKGDKGDPNGKIFIGADMHDLTKVEVVGCSIDTVRQLYTGTVKLERLQAIQQVLETGERLFGGHKQSPLSVQWHVTKMGMASGYRYKLQNNELGLVILFGSYYRSEETMCEERGPHLKIEFSPKKIAEGGTDNVQFHADICASWFFEDGDWEHSGIAIHLAADVQGWEPGPTFKERFRTKARAVRDYDGITHLEFDGLSTVAVSYGKKAAESYTYGKHSSLQTAIYDKSKEVLASDKKDFFDKEWEAYSLGRYDQDKPVWRIEYRYHHSVIAQFAESAGQELKKFTDLLPHLGALWRYALLRNRLDETPNGTYIDPLWQYLYDRMNVSFGPSERRLTRQYKKDTVAPAAKNYGQIVGNIVSVYARRGYNTRQVMLQLKRLDFYYDLVKLYHENGKGGEPGLREAVEKALCLRRLIGKAAA